MFNLPEMFCLKNKVALVTGATGHLGKEMSKALAMTGAHVIIHGRDKEKLNALAQEIYDLNGECTLCLADMFEHSLSDVLTPILEKQDHLDILVNNAYSPSISNFAQAYEIVVNQAYELIKLCEPYLKKTYSLHNSTASIINIGTMYAHVSPDPGVYGDSMQGNPPYYGPAKAALLQLTRYLACHYAAMGIRVNSMSPGPFPANAVQKEQAEFCQRLSEKVPMKRIGQPQEIVGPLLFLASNASSYVTGIDLKVDGGWTAW